MLRLILIAIGLALHWSAMAQKPNIVFIFADDMSYKTAGFMGHKTVKTPNLDALAESGIIFDRAYNMGAWTGAVCISSRTMLNAGKTVWRARDIDKLFANTKKTKALSSEAKESLELERNHISESFWASRMRKAGYDTYLSGKWHIKAPATESFEEIGTVRPGMPNQADIRYQRTFDEHNDNWSPFDKSFGGFWQGDKHWSEAQADEAIAYLDSKSSSDKPFFMYLSFNAPHDPRQAPKEFVDLYPIDNIALPESFVAKNEHMLTMGLLFPDNPNKKITRDENLGPLPRTEYSTKVNRQEYYAAISHMDEQIGRVINHLEENNLLHNTVIIFTADHGLAIGEHGLLGKQNLFEHSMRAPFFIAGKDIPKGERRQQRIYLQDAMATSLDIAEADESGVEFKSLLPAIEENENVYPHVYGAYLDTQRAIIKDNFKLILYPQGSIVQLYDLQQDPDELDDLAQLESSKSIIKELFQLLLEEQKRQNDRLDLVAVFPEFN